MKNISTNSEANINAKASSLSEIENALADLLIMSGVEEDELVGTMLTLKQSVSEQEEMLLYLWDNHPNPQQIFNKLISIVKRRQAANLPRN